MYNMEKLEVVKAERCPAKVVRRMLQDYMPW